MEDNNTNMGVGDGHARPAAGVDQANASIYPKLRLLPERKRLRLAGHSYCIAGLYFVTICTHRNVQCLSEIVDRRVVLSRIGLIADECWRSIPDHFDVEIDAFVVMPNHVHGIIRIPGIAEAGGVSSRGFPEAGGACPAPTLSTIIGSFKSACTRRIRQTIDPTFAWQRSYWDHIIRDAEDLERIRHYIRTNPENWERDEHN